METKKINRPKPIKTLSLIINKEKWRLYLYPSAVFNKIWHKTVAITCYSQDKNIREIFFSGPKVSKDTIAHELFHAYLFRTYMPSSDYGLIDEELACEIIGKCHRHLFNQVNNIYNKFNKK